MSDHYDIVIVGGGMVGASLAVALEPLGYRVAVIEAHAPDSDAQPSYDDRSTAVAESSRRVFETMGCWRAMEPVATPIRRIHVSDRGRFGVTRLEAAAHEVEALGYVVENRDIGEALWGRLREGGTAELVCPARVIGLEQSGDEATLVVEGRNGGRSLTARLVVAADGVRSPVRALLGIEAETRDYGQSAVIANVSPSRDHACEAYERFTDTGPLALLPMTGGRCSLVWTLGPGDAERMRDCDETEFLERLQRAFGFRLGRFLKAGRRQAYPLALTRAGHQAQGRVVLVGNAAHGIHPVAGQGFNLGLRDVATLAEVLADGREGGDPGAAGLLASYLEWREDDHRRVMDFTDSLVRIFTNPLGPVRVARNLGLLGMDLLPPAKSELARRGMGFVGRLPRMARGLPLI